MGIGAGKSMMKNVLPQSTSDFIYAIIAEEYGMLGAISLLFLFMLVVYCIAASSPPIEFLLPRL